LRALTLNEEEVKNLIINGDYDKAAEEIFEIIEGDIRSLDKEILHKCLSLLNLICDKSPSISLRAVKSVEYVVNDQNSWIRLESLEILYQISMYRPNLLIELIDKIRTRLFDQDPPIRRLTVKIVGNLILSLYIDLEELQ
jgi:hypothetical protein